MDSHPKSSPLVEPSALILVKHHHWDTHEPRWEGPYTVVLTTPAAVKVADKMPWIYHSNVKVLDTQGDHPQDNWRNQLVTL